MKTTRTWVRVLVALLLLALLAPCSALALGDTLEAYNDASVTIGVPTGAMAMNAVEARFPNANIQYITLDTDGYVAVTSGKVDAFAHDSIVLQYACEENPQLRMLEETFGKTEIAVGISRRRDDLLDPINAFLQELIDTGLRDEMHLRWRTDAANAMPTLDKPAAPTQTLRVGTSGVSVPMSYYGEDGALTGFDIELLARMSLQMNVSIELSVMNYDALVAGLESGKLDIVVANLNITPERAERISYSIPYLTAATGLVVKNTEAAAPASASAPMATLADMQAFFGEGKRLGIVTGTVFDQLTQTYFPQAERVYVNNFSDLILSLQAGRIDGYLVNQPQGYAQCLENDQLWMPDIQVVDDQYAIALPLGSDALCAQLNAFIAKTQADGTLDALADKWFLTDEAQKPMPPPATTGENGTLRLATSGDCYPFTYMREGEAVGYSVELFQLFCAEQGYGCEVQVYDFSSMIAALSSGKADAASDCLSITEERKELMLFTDPTYDGGVMMILPASLQTGAAEPTEEGLWASISASFERTFIREGRWRLILQGLWTTLVISVCSAALGTVLGFGVCMLRRSRLRVLSGFARCFIRLMQGTPIVVFLMILYYIVFGDVDPVLVAIVGFALNFAAYVSEMMRTGIDAVDPGQIEAASAIGFTKARAFTLITLPQAARHFLPVFRGEFISLVKMTSVVGYISIMDLTKMSDIIRSRTYEAFFPLIATAIIYFLLSWILAQGLSAVELRIDPKRKKRVVKGVREEEIAQ